MKGQFWESSLVARNTFGAPEPDSAGRAAALAVVSTCAGTVGSRIGDTVRF